jgi:hypothetical protein
MEWLYKYQTLIVGIVGFAGVIFTLFYNAKTVRDQRDEEREHERKALRAALIAELQINRYALEENSRQLREKPSKGVVFVPTDRMDGTYQSFLPRIGLLSEGEVSKVMSAYLTLETYNAKLFLVGAPVHTSPRHVEVPAKNFKLLAAIQERVLEPVDQAIEALEGSAQ